MHGLRRYLRWSKRLSIPSRYLLSTLLVAVVAAVRLAFDPIMASYPYMLFFLAVILSALLWNTGTGFYATALSAATAVFLFVVPSGSFQVADPGAFVGLVAFVAVSMVITTVAEALRWLADHLDSEEEQKEVLFHELAHRTRDNLQIIGRGRGPDLGDFRSPAEFLNARVRASHRRRSRAYPASGARSDSLQKGVPMPVFALLALGNGPHPSPHRHPAARHFPNHPGTSSAASGLLME